MLNPKCDDDSESSKRSPITLLERRKIEAEITAPLVRAFAAEIGEERAVAIVRGVIDSLARRAGGELARSVAEASLQAFASCLDRWTEGNALEIETIESTENRLAFNVVRCRYAEMYHALGLGDLGSTLSCRRDFSLVEGFNPNIKLARTQTIMEGASHCDFRFEATGGESSESASLNEGGGSSAIGGGDRSNN